MIQGAPEDVNGTTKQPRIPLECTSKKAVRVTLSNVLRVLEQHPAWHKALGYDELLKDVVLHTRPPYLSDTGPWTIRPITEQDYRETANWLQRTYHFYAGSPLAGEGLTTYAYRFPFHPIRDYLDGLTWDGIARLDTWLATYCQVGLTPYTSAVASKTLIAAVARVYEPGCKVDTMTILEGEQGTLKSTVWNTLASDAWFTDWLPDLHDKDAPQTLCGKWFVEFGELSQFQRSEVETVKRFVSAKQDHYRPAYGRKAATFPRQNIFVGSTNEAHYFKDHTGNRRFWPVTLDGEADIAGLARDRDQLWAEAVIRYRQGDLWYLTGELATAAVQEQAERVELDDWEAVVLPYAEAHATPTDRQKVYDATTPTLRFITTADILEHAFNLANPLHWTLANTKRLGGILRRKGWKVRPVWNADNTKQFKAFVKILPEPQAPPGTPVTGNIEEKPPTGNSESRSNDALVTSVTSVTDNYINTEENQGAFQTSIERGVTEVTEVTRASLEGQGAFQPFIESEVTGVTGVTDSERPPGVSPTSNASGLAVSEATFPPGRSLPGEAGEVLSREGLSERSERPLTGSPTRVLSPSPGGSGAAGAGALACSCGGLWLPTGDGRCTRCNAVRP